MQVINVQVVIKDENADTASGIGLTERAYVTLSNAIGASGVGEVIDVQPMHGFGTSVTVNDAFGTRITYSK